MKNPLIDTSYIYIVTFLHFVVKVQVGKHSVLTPMFYFTDNGTVLMSDDEKDFVSMQKALYFSLGFEILGAILFLLTAFFVVSDKEKAEEAERIEAGK